MSRSNGDHLKWNEVKEGIIEFVASRGEAVPEPDIRKHLAEKYGITDLKNIKKHLSDLQCQPISCIEKIRPKPGFVNKWEIRRIENIKKIRLHFPEIQLKTYEKPLEVVVKRASPYSSNLLIANKLRIQLLLSNSLFDTFVKTDSEIVYERAYKLYKHSFDKWGKEYPECKQRVLDDIARGIAAIKFPILIGEGQIGMSNVTELINKALEIEAIKDVESELMSYLNEWDKSGEEFEMRLPRYISLTLIEKMFELCFQNDIMDNIVSPEEIWFVNETKNMRAYLKADPEINLISELQAYDDFYVQCFKKFKTKTGIPQTSISL